MKSVTTKLSTELLKHRREMMPTATSEDARYQHYFDLRLLANLNQKLCHADKTYDAIPFHRILSQQSPLYSQTMELCERLHLELKPALKTTLRQQLQFDPFDSVLEYPKTIHNLLWVVNFSQSSLILDEFSLMRKFHWSVFHDALYQNLIRLLPCKSAKDLRYYFHFLESFVGIQESWLRHQIGDEVYLPLKVSGMLNDIAAADIYPTKSSADQICELILADHLKTCATKKWTTQEWFRLYSKQYKRYPMKLNKPKAAKIQRFEFPSFDPKFLKKNKSVLKDFYAWYCDLSGLWRPDKHV